ncbi:hypothetical protein F3J14_14295 [Burkholderia sp. Tr-862]|uniref:hypothetical protein n=1 Tax=Burkholderia sp. Tr-862 TaxID=2608331 RepID=UPI001419B504|nr:hypothetical protein [Burkholderia sp. Tr-862]NIF42035.1 hypothetical protein [Burkholderia sp. Tr-862]
MVNKEHVAKAIEIIGAFFGLLIAYQAVRFCQGAIGAPILDQAIEYIGRPFAAAIKQQLGIQLLYVDTGSSNFYDQVPAWIQKGTYFLVGISVWLQLGLLEQSCTRAAARIYMVGFDQYCDEVRAARAEAQRERQIYEARERRRELRRKQREAAQPKSGFSVATLVAGIIIGTFFF